MRSREEVAVEVNGQGMIELAFGTGLEPIWCSPHDVFCWEAREGCCSAGLGVAVAVGAEIESLQIFIRNLIGGVEVDRYPQQILGEPQAGGTFVEWRPDAGESPTRG